MVYEALPPSYQPQKQGRRPSARGAKIVSKNGKNGASLINQENRHELSYDLQELRDPELFGALPADRNSSADGSLSIGNNSRRDGDLRLDNARPRAGQQTQAPSFQPRQRRAAPNAAPQNSSSKMAEETFPPVYRPANRPIRRAHPAQNSAVIPASSATAFMNPHTDAASRGLTPQNQISNANPSATHSKKPRRTKKRFFLAAGMIILLFVTAVGGWGFYLYNYGSQRMHRIAALSGAADTPGTTYLIAGSDQRQGEEAESIPGRRSDTIMLLHLPESGTPALISIPRDTYALIPDYGGNKINAAFALGGAPLLVKTVENLSGLTIDHYIEIGMDGVVALTDAVGGINVCYDADVNDSYSELVWTAGCHDVDGKTALAFSRMRYQDPEGDIGRAKRQRQVVSKILDKAISKDTFLNPFQQKRLVGAGASILTADESDSLWDIGISAFALRKATGKDGVTGTPPIGSLNYRARGMAGAAVQLDPEQIDAFWNDLREGTLSPEKYETIRRSE